MPATATLAARVRALSPDRLAGMRRGIEKESLRVNPDGSLALTPHPAALGSALTHPCITTVKSYNPTYEPNPRQLPKAIELIMEAERPVVFSGGGVILSKASKELREFVKRIHAPITSSLMGLGAYPGTDPLWLGMIGMHGTYCANMAVHYSDLVIAVGARFDDRVTGKVSEFCPFAKVIHIDIDPTSIRKNIHVDIPIVGDCRAVLRELNQILRATVNGNQKDLRKPWWDQIREWQQAHPLAYQQEPDGAIKPQHVVKRLYELTTDHDPIVATDVGQHQMWTAQYFKQILKAAAENRLP